jgi:hypothetical protein
LIRQAVVDPLLQQCNVAVRHLGLGRHPGISRFPPYGPHQASILNQFYHIAVSGDEDASTRIGRTMASCTILLHHGPDGSGKRNICRIASIGACVVFRPLQNPLPDQLNLVTAQLLVRRWRHQVITVIG